MKRKLPRRAVPFAVAGGVLLVALIGWLAVVSPQRSQASSLQKQIDDAQAQLTSLTIQPKGPSNRGRVKIADVFRLSKAIPNEVRMPDILLELNQVAGASGITFASITPRIPVVLPSYQVVPIDVVFRGNYYELSDFLYRVRNLVEVHDGLLTSTGRLFTVDRIGFAQGQGGFPQIDATLSIDAYVYGGVPAETSSSTSTSTSATGTTSTTTTTSPSSQAAAAGATP